MGLNNLPLKLMPINGYAYLGVTKKRGSVVVSRSLRPTWMIISTKYVMVINEPNLKTKYMYKDLTETILWIR